MLKNFKFNEQFNNFIIWSNDAFSNDETIIQLAIVALSFAISALFYGLIRNRVQKAIDSSSLPIRVKRVITNLRRTILPITALFAIFIGSIIASSEFMGVISISLNYVIMKVLVAWIVVRVSVQFISNTLVRNIFALSIFVVLALSIFGVLDQTTTMLDAIGFSFGEFRVSALAIIKGMFSIFVLLYLAIFASTFVERSIFQSKSLNRSSQVLIAKITRVTLIVFALLIAVTSAGIDLSLFAVFGGAVGLGVGFGLQKGVSNLFSGMLLLLDRSIKPGDVIEIPDIGTFGWVNNMAARHTEIVTRDNKSFLIPNEDFITQRVVNWSHGNSYIRLQVSFGVHYDSDPEEVIAVAIEAAKKPERVVDYRQPVCWITEFGDSSVNFTLRFWIKDAEQGITNIRGQVFLELWKAFKEHDIRIPYPHREVYMHEVPDHAKPKSKKKKPSDGTKKKSEKDT